MFRTFASHLRHQWRGLFAVLACAAALVAPATAQAVTSSSDFAADNQGWQISFPDEGFIAPAPWADGAISSPGKLGSVPMFFKAPSGYYGQWANYGGLLQFDLRLSAASATKTPWVWLTLDTPDGTVKIAGHAQSGSANSYPTTAPTTFYVPLWTLSGIPWVHADNGPNLTQPIPEDELRGYLNGNVTDLKVLADYQADTPETTYLDNVRLSEPADVSRTLTLTYSAKRGVFRGQLQSQDDDSCATGQTIEVLKRRRGPDAVVGNATSDSTGGFRLKLQAKKGKYYASTAVSYDGLSGGAPSRCAAANSPVVAVG